MAVIELRSRFIRIGRRVVRDRNRDTQLLEDWYVRRQFSLCCCIKHVRQQRRGAIAVAEIAAERQPTAHVDSKVAIESALHQIQGRRAEVGKSSITAVLEDGGLLRETRDHRN